jgi:hypothetical protein
MARTPDENEAAQRRGAGVGIRHGAKKKSRGESPRWTKKKTQVPENLGNRGKRYGYFASSGSGFRAGGVLMPLSGLISGGVLGAGGGAFVQPPITVAIKTKKQHMRKRCMNTPILDRSLANCAEVTAQLPAG